MGNMRSRAGILVGVAAAAGAFGAAAMMSAGTAPNAHADDTTLIIDAVDGDFTAGQSEFMTASADFGGGEFVPGLTAFLDGVDDDTLSAPNNLVIGTVEELENQAISPSIDFEITTPVNFSDALAEAQGYFTAGESDLAAIPTLLSEGLYSSAVLDGLFGTDIGTVLPLEELLLGAVVS